MIFNIKGLTKRYNRVILDQAALSMESGNVYCLLGRNGAGKTTLMKILSGTVPYEEGQIYTSNDHSQKTQVYYVPEHPIFLEYLTGYEHLDMHAKINGYKLKKAELDNFVEQMGIASFCNDFIFQYSHGMKHQLALAMAFLITPPVLLLDEPLVSLDPINIYDMKQRLIDYARKDHIVLVSTHMIPIAQQIGDHILVLSNGKITQVKNDFSEKDLEQFVLNLLSAFPQQNTD